MGHRGKKKHRQDQRVQKQRRINEEERREELQRRPSLAKKVRAKISAIARFCDEGYVVSAHKEGTKPYSPHIFTVDGLVQKLDNDWVYDPSSGRRLHKVTGVVVLPWENLHSRFLRKILRSAWAPKVPKTVLDQIVVATSES